MDFLKTANSWWMYLFGIIVTLYVLAGCIFFIIKSFKDARKYKMDTKVLKKTIFNSAVFTILPSVGILIGIIALSGSLGTPLPWIRLTVIGALHYEITAVDIVLKNFGTTELNNVIFVTVAFTMTLGILSGPLYCLFGFKAYDKKVLSKAPQKCFLSDEQWNDNTMADECSGKYGNTYLTEFLSKQRLVPMPWLEK